MMQSNFLLFDNHSADWSSSNAGLEGHGPTKTIMSGSGPWYGRYVDEDTKAKEERPDGRAKDLPYVGMRQRQTPELGPIGLGCRWMGNVGRQRRPSP